MKSVLTLLQIALFFLAIHCSFASAQITGTDTGATGDGSGVGQTQINIGSEVDTSAFDSIDRSGVAGSTADTQAGSAGAGANNANTGGVGGFGGGGFGGLGGLGALFGGNGFGGGGQSSQPIIRTRLRSAIDVTPTTPRQVQSVLNQRIVQIPNRAGLQRTNIQMVGRTAVVSGTVQTDRERRMAELLMRLEPGVSKVQNNIVVLPVQ